MVVGVVSRDKARGGQSGKGRQCEIIWGRKGRVPKILIEFGLALIAAAVLLYLVRMIVEVAIPAGILLVIIGVIWHLMERSEKKASA